MDRHDAKTRRPSLLAGGPEPARGSTTPGRILPSIDPADAHAAPPAPARAWPWLLAAVLGVTTLATLLLTRPPPGTRALAPMAPPGLTEAAAPEPPAGTATIIEEPGLPTEVALGPSSPLPSSLLSSSPGPALAGAVAGPESPFAAMAHPGADVAAPNPFVGHRAPAAPTPARPRAAAAEPDDQALLATLLGHIHARPTPESAQAATAPAAAGAGFRSHQIQMNLRECPPANTAEGVACRREICAVYAGRDPACPAG